MDKRALLKITIGVIALFFTIQWVGLESLLSGFTAVDLTFFVFGIGCYLALVSVWALKVYYTFNRAGFTMKYQKAWWINIWGMFGNIFQQSVGLIFFGRAANSVTAQGTISMVGLVLAIQGIEIVVRVVLTGVGIAIFPEMLGSSLSNYIVIFAIGVLPIIFFIVVFNSDKRFVVRLLSFLPAKVREFFLKFTSHVHFIKSSLLGLFGITLIACLVRGVEWVVLSYAVGSPISFKVGFFLSNPVLFTKLIPVPLGLGVYDFSVAYALQEFGMPIAQGVTFAMLDRLDDVLIALLALTQLGMQKIKIGSVANE